MAAYPISIPGASSRMDMMSPSSMASPFSMSSPYSAHSSLSNNSTSQTLASSFATSVTSAASAVSPSDCGSAGVENGVGGGNESTKKHKPHECDVCGACFARKVHLQRHSLRHQVCKPYCCERCGKCFSRQDSLVRHHRLLHEKIKEKPRRSSGSSKKKSSGKVEGRVCVRCNQLGVKCDGLKPCSRCNSSTMATSLQCSYSSKSSSPREGNKPARGQSLSQMTNDSTSSSYGGDDDEEMSIAGEAASAFSPFGGHGPRRNTVSNMESSSSTATLFNDYGCSFPRTYDDGGLYPTTSNNFTVPEAQQPHPFEMPQLDPSLYIEVKSLHPHQLHQHQPFASHETQPEQQQHHQQQQYSVGGSVSDHDVPPLSLFSHGGAHEGAFNWASMMQTGANMEEQGQEREPMPFSKSASDQSLNATLSRGPEGQDNSCFPSPSINALQKLFPTEQQQQEGAAAAAAASLHSNPTVNLASLGLPVPPNLNISLPADLQMSAENWDNLMRCLTSMANNRHAESMKA